MRIENAETKSEGQKIYAVVAEYETIDMNLVS